MLLLSIPGRAVRGIIKVASMPPSKWWEGLTGMWATVKKEANHYWAGTKLLGVEIRISSKYVIKVLRGQSLTRRERKQLTRTCADIFRMVPLLIFVLVPFLEFLLPVALMLFPNLLPSTFEDKLKKEEQMKKRLAIRLQYARFLQDTMEEMAKTMSTRADSDKKVQLTELMGFINRARAGDYISNDEIERIAKLFRDELTLDNLDRVHLVGMVKLLGLAPYGTDTFLRARLRQHLEQLRQDDRAIKEEGLANMTVDELRSACRARGMRASYGEGSDDLMRKHLEKWLDLSLNRSVPSSLLLLSRSFSLLQRHPQAEADHVVRDVGGLLGNLPQEVIQHVAMEECKDKDEHSSLQRRLEFIRKEEEHCREEEEEMRTLDDIQKRELERIRSSESSDPRQAAAATAAAAIMTEAAATLGIEGGASQEAKMAKKQEKMQKVLKALAVLANASGVTEERQLFMTLVTKEVDKMQQQLNSVPGSRLVFTSKGLSSVRSKGEGSDSDTETSARQWRLLNEQVSDILHRIEQQIDHVDTSIGEKLHLIDLDNDGYISYDEIKHALGLLKEQIGATEFEALLESMTEQGDGRLQVEELRKMADAGVQDKKAKRAEAAM